MTFQFGKYVRQFDLFAKPFVFLIGEKKFKSTLIGGFLSLCIITISVVYFYYLIHMYFDNKVQPKLTQSIAIENGMNTIHINDNFFVFEMLIAGEPLKRYEKRVGKQYLSYEVYYEQQNSDGTSTYERLPLIECDDPQFDGFLCIPANIFAGGKDIYYDPFKKLGSYYSIMIIPCDKNESDICASEKEINDIIFKPTNFFQLFTKIVQYNTNERQYKTSYKQEFFFFDQKIISYTIYDLFKGTTTVTEGLIYQKSESRDTIYDYKKNDSFFTNDDTIEERMGIYGYACILYKMNEVHNYIDVQHAMITEVLAQFMSIFNSMLLIGIGARMLAESNIVGDINNILLKEYYKQTALKLVKKYDTKNSIVKIKKDRKKNQNLDSSKNITCRAKLEEFNRKSKQDQTLELQNKINEVDFSESQNQYFDLGLWQKLKLSFLSLFGKQWLINMKPDKNPDAFIYQNLLVQSMKRINILEVYKDLIKLKMAMKLVLTKDQYAAIHFCGSEIASQQQLATKIQINKNKQENNFKNINSNNKIDQKKIQTSIQSENQINIINNNVQYKFESPVKQEKNVSDQKILSQINSEAFLNQTNYNDPQSLNSEKIVLSTKNKQLENLQRQNLKYIKQYNLSKQNSQKIKKEKQIIQQIRSQSSLHNQAQNQQKKQKQIEQRDKVQIQNLKGDDYIINESEQTIQDISDLQKNCVKTQQQIQEVKPKLLKQKSVLKFHNSRHLQEMDKIEDDISQREKFLQEFLDKMSQQNDTINPDISHIDKQIYSSLIFNDSLI